VISDNSTKTDRLLAQARAGDRAAIEALYSAHRAYLRCVIDLRMDDELRRRVDVSDVVQETQLEAIGRMQEYLRRPTVSFRIWLRQTALEQLINLRRRHVLARKRTVRSQVRLPDHSSVALAQNLLPTRPSEIVRGAELAQQVRQAVAEMDEPDREIILLRHFEELTNAEAAELLQIDPAAMRKRHGRALRRLGQQLAVVGVVGEES
jgi:RNA polymerase sigma-70 factor (ECF subfamily)